MTWLTELIATLALVATTGYLLWTILEIRQRRLNFAAEGGDNYRGEAKEPEALSIPDSEALDQMDEMLQQAGFSMPEEE